jgi:hypothetical protein
MREEEQVSPDRPEEQWSLPGRGSNLKARTGLASSALRFYERKGLLSATARAAASDPPERGVCSPGTAVSA